MPDTTLPAVADRSRKIQDDRRRRRTSLGVVAMVLLIVTGGAVAHVWVRLQALQVAYALGKARQEHEHLLEARRKLKIEIGTLEDPSRIVTLARDKLGMSPPDPADIRVVALGRTRTGGGAAEGRP